MGAGVWKGCPLKMYDMKDFIWFYVLCVTFKGLFCAEKADLQSLVSLGLCVMLSHPN